MSFKPSEQFLPDFDEMDQAANAVAKLKISADKVKYDLDAKLADCIKSAYLNKELWVNGKPPTQSYIESVVKVIGNTPEDREIISNLTIEYRNLQRSAEETSNLLETLRHRVSVFQTVSANKRQGMV